MAWYSAGTVTATNNSTTFTGSGTAFLGNVRVGDALTIAGSTSLHEVTAIASDTQLTFQPPYTGTTGSGKAYCIAPIMGYDKDLSDAFNSIRLQWGTQLSALKPWATASTAAQARTDLGAGTTGSSLFTAATAATGRSVLGLGSAANETVQTSPRDATLGRLLINTAWGLGLGGSGTHPTGTDYNGVDKNEFISTSEVGNASMVASGLPASAFMQGINFYRSSNVFQRLMLSWNSPTQPPLGFLQTKAPGGAWYTAEIFTTANLRPNVLASYTLATLPNAAANPRLQAWCSNLTGGARPVYSDGTNWCRVFDNSIAN